jgi:hypothetical protein
MMALRAEKCNEIVESKQVRTELSGLQEQGGPLTQFLTTKKENRDRRCFAP